MPDERKILFVSSIPPDIAAFNADGSKKASWSDLTALTWKVLRRYCDLHDYTFRHNVSDIHLPLVSPYVDVLPSAHQSAIRYMIKFQLMHFYLREEMCHERWDWVVWIDADCFPVQMDVPVTKFTNTRARETSEAPETYPFEGDLILPWDINGLHPTVIIARSSQLSRDMFWSLTEAGDRLFRQHQWSDNFALRFLIDVEPYRGMVHWHSAKTLCAQHPGIYPPFSKLYEFEEGASWALHLSAMSLERRIEFAQQYIDRYKLLG